MVKSANSPVLCPTLAYVGVTPPDLFILSATRLPSVALRAPLVTFRRSRGGSAMPLNLIKSEYRITPSQPDRDSVHFYANDPDAFHTLNLAAHMNSSGGVQLRLDAIDALETHYTPRVRGSFLQHQPLGLAHAAGERLLE